MIKHHFFFSNYDYYNRTPNLFLSKSMSYKDGMKCNIVDCNVVLINIKLQVT